MSIRCLYLLAFLWLSALTANALDRPSSENTAKEALAQPPQSSVVVIPINEAIDKANLFILRRALKQAISDQVDCVVLDMDTPGGRLDVTLEMMEMLARFEGETATYVNVDAISAGPSLRRPPSRFILRPREKWVPRRSFRVGVPRSQKRQP
jgi:membrane-bound serine protease (ClpP class)